MASGRDKEDTDDIAVLPIQTAASTTNLDVEEKYDDEITPVIDEKDMKEAIEHAEQADITPEMRRKIVEYYGRKVEEDDIAPASDVTIILEKIIEMDEEHAMDICANAITYHASDPNFPSVTMAKLKHLVLGYKGADMDPADWSFELRTEACMLHWHSPYPEVRSVTDPFDDFTVPVETPRAYFLGMAFMSGATLINTFFSPRQPSRSRLHLCRHTLMTRYFDWGQRPPASTRTMRYLSRQGSSQMVMHHAGQGTLLWRMHLCAQPRSMVLQGTDAGDHHVLNRQLGRGNLLCLPGTDAAPVPRSAVGIVSL